MTTSLWKFELNQWKSIKELKDDFQFDKTNLVLCFGQKQFLMNQEIYSLTHKQFPKAHIVFCSTAGAIFNNQVTDKDAILVAMNFEKTTIDTASINITECNNSYEAAIQLVQKLPKKDLTYIMILSDGSLINGSELVKGLKDAVTSDIKISGGLAGDGSNFKSTLVGLNKNPDKGDIIAIGFYGSALQVQIGSKGGWTPFGLEKRITKSQNNVLIELENKNALDIYKTYLGEEVHNLPSSALLFPLSITLPNVTNPVVRTILSINEEEKTMTFAGDMPEGSKVRFMRSNFTDLTNAAAEAANHSMEPNHKNPSFSLLISCVGRKLIMGDNISKEVNAVMNAIGNQTIIAGFYSYGEIAPFHEGENCQLHNQTMTVTSFYEKL